MGADFFEVGKVQIEPGNLVTQREREVIAGLVEPEGKLGAQLVVEAPQVPLAVADRAAPAFEAAPADGGNEGSGAPFFEAQHDDDLIGFLPRFHCA